jgi:hypothetical protein
MHDVSRIKYERTGESLSIQHALVLVLGDGARQHGVVLHGCEDIKC